MKRLHWTLTIGSVWALTLALGGCTPENKVTPGAPVMLKFAVVTLAGTEPSLVTEAGAPAPAPPMSFFYALFDRILDPTALEEIDPDGGAITEKDGVASVAWSGGEIPASTLYIPNGSAKWTLIPAGYFGLPYGVGPSITIAPSMGLPSGAMVTVTLAADKVRSHDQKDSFQAGMGVASPLLFETEPLSVRIDVPVAPAMDGGADIDGGGQDAVDGGTDDDAGGGQDAAASPPPVVHVVFNNLTPDKTADQIAVQVNGAAIAPAQLAIARDSSTPGAWTVGPAAGETWPIGAIVTVTVPAEVADNFEVALGKPVTASFTVFEVKP